MIALGGPPVDSFIVARIDRTPEQRVPDETRLDIVGVWGLTSRIATDGLRCR